MTGKTTDFTLATLANIPTSSEKGCLVHIGAANGSDGFSLGVGDTTFDDNGNNLIFETCPNNWTVLGPIGTGWKHLAVVVDSAGAVAGYVDSVENPDIVATGDITSELQAAIDAASDGDTIIIGAGTCTASGVDWDNKNITIRGQGIGVTTVTGLTFDVLVTTKAQFRISGMSVGAADQWLIDAGDRTTGIKGWRIDHVAFAHPSYEQHIAIKIQGLTWGLIDNCTFDNCGNAIFTSGYAESTIEVLPGPPDGDPGLGGLSWAMPLDLGSDEATYIEDCTFTNDTGAFYGVGDNYYGSRHVFRHNSVLNAYWQCHACRGAERGGVCKVEIYNNTFDATDSDWARAIHLRAGTGVIFNNTLTGFFNTIQCDNQRSNGQSDSDPYGAADGTHAWDGNLGVGDQAGWPCLDQIGRGPGEAFGDAQPSEPVYVWDNTVDMVSDGDNNVQEGRDFINGTARPSYTPLTYPHPSRGS